MSSTTTAGVRRRGSARGRRAVLGGLGAVALGVGLAAGPAAADPRQTVVEALQPTVSCEGTTSDGSIIEFHQVALADGTVVESYLEVIAADWGAHLAEGTPLSATFAGGVVEATFDLVDPSGASVGTARFAGTYVVGETETTTNRWQSANSQWHSTQSYTPYELSWSSTDLGPWQVGSLECTAWASEGTTSYTQPHRSVADGAYYAISEECTSGGIDYLDVVTHDQDTYLLVEAGGLQGFVTVSGDGTQTGDVHWYDMEGEPVGSGSATASWTPDGQGKRTVASPSQEANLVTHATGFVFAFDVEAPDGSHLGTTCGIDLVEFRQIGGVGE